MPQVAVPSKKRVAAGTFAALSPSEPWIAKRKKVAVGTFAAPETAIDFVTSTPKMVAAGTNMANLTGPLGEKVKKGKSKQSKKRVSYKVILDRIVMVAEMLVEEYEVFFLGGASPHMTHQLFMLGGKWTDTSSWRIKGILGEIYLPETSERVIGYKEGGRKMDDEDIKTLRECLQDTTHPFCGMNVHRFLEIGRMLMPEWYDTWEKNKWEAKPLVLRSLHNAWVLKYREEPIANDLSQDPDRYYTYIRKRLEKDNHPILVKRLDYLAKKSGLKLSGQTDLEIYLKGKNKKRRSNTKGESHG